MVTTAHTTRQSLRVQHTCCPCVHPAGRHAVSQAASEHNTWPVSSANSSKPTALQQARHQASQQHTHRFGRRHESAASAALKNLRARQANKQPNPCCGCDPAPGIPPLLPGSTEKPQKQNLCPLTAGLVIPLLLANTALAGMPSGLLRQPCRRAVHKGADQHRSALQRHCHLLTVSLQLLMAHRPKINPTHY